MKGYFFNDEDDAFAAGFLCGFIVASAIIGIAFLLTGILS
jgi:hypothetical protein